MQPYTGNPIYGMLCNKQPFDGSMISQKLVVKRESIYGQFL